MAYPQQFISAANDWTRATIRRTLSRKAFIKRRTEIIRTHRAELHAEAVKRKQVIQAITINDEGII